MSLSLRVDTARRCLFEPAYFITAGVFIPRGGESRFDCFDVCWNARVDVWVKLTR